MPKSNRKVLKHKKNNFRFPIFIIVFCFPFVNTSTGSNQIKIGGLVLKNVHKILENQVLLNKHIAGIMSDLCMAHVSFMRKSCDLELKNFNSTSVRIFKISVTSAKSW